MDKGLRTVNDIRVMLVDEIQKLRSGDTTAANVNAIVNATGKILSTIKVEIEYNKLLGKTPQIPFIEAGRKNLPEPEDKGKSSKA